MKIPFESEAKPMFTVPTMRTKTLVQLLGAKDEPQDGCNH